VTTDKNELRALARKKRAAARKSATQSLIKTYGDSLIAYLAKRDGVQVVAAYWPINDEFDCRELMLKLERCGYDLALPVVVGPGLPLVFRRYQNGMNLKSGPFQTRHPAPSEAELTPDVILCPLLAFDKSGARLGYGGGYYDRTLQQLKKTHPVLAIGLGFAAQELDDVPMTSHDMKLDGVITEFGFRECGA